MFIEPCVKISGAYYRDVLLGQHLLPAIRSVTADFCTYNAPAHRADDTVEFLSHNTPDFISPLPWPPNSPDLNPVDYDSSRWDITSQHSDILAMCCKVISSFVIFAVLDLRVGGCRP